MPHRQPIQSSKKSIGKRVWFFVVGTLFLASESLGGYAVLAQFLDFLLTRTPSEDQDTLKNEDWGSLAVTVVATLPYMALLLVILSGKHVHHKHLAPKKSHQSENRIHEGLHLVGDGIIMIPFGLLTYAGASDVLRKTKLLSRPMEIALATLLGLFSWGGNGVVHSANLHAETGHAFDLLRSIKSENPSLPRCSPCGNWTKLQCKAFWMGAVLVVSHALQGILDGDSFLDSINAENPWLRSFILASLATLVTLIEGNSEARSIFAHYVEEAKSQKSSPSSHRATASQLPAFHRTYLAFSAVWHSLQPAAGFLSLSDEISKLINNKLFHEILPGGLPVRIIITALLILVSQPNSVGFYRLTEPGLLLMLEPNAGLDLRRTGGDETIHRASAAAGEGERDSLLPPPGGAANGHTPSKTPDQTLPHALLFSEQAAYSMELRTADGYSSDPGSRSGSEAGFSSDSDEDKNGWDGAHSTSLPTTSSFPVHEGRGISWGRTKMR